MENSFESFADTAQQPHVQLTMPFKKIAMALSGGGFRAAAYSLGTMSYLERLGLMNNVEFISSTSGGTFTGMYYAAAAKKNCPFPDIYHDMIKFMEGQTILEDVLKTINNEAAWSGQEKTRNFINAFAKTYDEELFKGETFGIYWDKPGSVIYRKIEVCFNATDFYRGISFRFQTSGKTLPDDWLGEGKTGNQYIFLDTRTASNLAIVQQIKLGDIAAASSCFPAGFEPIVYPQDFSYGNLKKETLAGAMTMTDYNGHQHALSAPFGLMDGGVDDNQGVYGTMLADHRRRKVDANNGFDIILVTDVASYFMDPYKMDDHVGASKKNIESVAQGLFDSFRRFSNVLKGTGVIALAALIAAIILLAFCQRGQWTNLGYLLLSPAILILIVVAFIYGYKSGNPFIKKLQQWLTASNDDLVTEIKETLPGISSFSDDSLQLLLKYLKETPLPVLKQIIGARVNSTLSLVLDINLKQTRRLIFEIFYGNNMWDNRRVFNVIYELSTFNQSNRLKVLATKFKDDTRSLKLLTHSMPEINAIAERARNMGTTLWFDSKDTGKLKDIIACGQFTTCAKLLEYCLMTENVMTRESALPPEEKSILFNDNQMAFFNSIKKQVLEDWQLFAVTPFFLYDDYQTKKK